MCPTLPKDTRIIRQNVSKYCCGTWKSRQIFGTHKHYSPLENINIFSHFIFLHSNILFWWILFCKKIIILGARSETYIIIEKSKVFIRDLLYLNGPTSDFRKGSILWENSQLHIADILNIEQMIQPLKSWLIHDYKIGINDAPKKSIFSTK